jgi:cytochrome c2
MERETTHPTVDGVSESRVSETPFKTRIGLGLLRLAIIAVTTHVIVASAADSAEAKAIFRKRCTACHTFGRGVKVGPDLKGVTERRTLEWVVRFVRDSSGVIQSGDPTATGS